MSDYLTTERLRFLLRDGGSLSLGKEAIEKLANNELGKEEPDIQWLYDCAMEQGNSSASYDDSAATFNQAGCCTLGIVCEVTFDQDNLSEAAKKKMVSDETVWPEDMGDNTPSSVEIYYDGFHDEEDKEDDYDDEC